MMRSLNQDNCAACGLSLDEHEVVRLADDAIPGFDSCLGLRANFVGRSSSQRRADWADDWCDALHTLFLDDGDDAHLFRRIRVALLAAHQAGLQGESLFFSELPTKEAR